MELKAPNKMQTIFKYVLIIPIKGYRLILSPILGPSCRFQPTCSSYALEALEKHGLLRGTWLTINRLAKCHPWGGYGIDPVPEKKDEIP